jgi:ABC-2 type transport system permease protein
MRQERFAVILYSLLLFVCAYFIVIIFPSIQKIQALKNYMEQMPPFIKAFFGTEALQFTRLEGFLTIEFFNTTWVYIAGVFTAMFAGSLIAEEVEKKTLEILLSTPLRRRGLVIEKFLGFITCLIIVTLFSYLGIIAGAAQIGEKVDYMLYLRVFVSGILCMISIGAIALFVSCVAREQRRATGISIAFFFSLYFFNIIAALLEQYPVLGYFSLFHYFDASKILKYNAIQWDSLFVLLTVAVVFLAASVIHFQRKEIYV